MGRKNQDKEKNGIKKLMPFFKISFIIHLILLILFLLFAFKKTIFIPFKLIENKATATKDDLPASLKPRKSEFGTTVLFDDIPQFKPPKKPAVASLPQKEQKLTKAKEPQKEIPAAKKTITKPKEPIKKEATIQKTPEKEIKKSAQKPKVKIAQTSKIPPLKKEQEKDKSLEEEKKLNQEQIEEKIKQIEEKQALISQQPLMASKLRTFGKAAENKSPMTKTPKKSIVAMTKGFIENLKDKGDDWLERKGDDSKRPSFEELKYISYEQKINWYLQSAWKQNFSYQRTSIPNGKVIVDFSIDEDGNIQNVNLIQSSGYPNLDKIVLKHVELASPLPPLPKHFNKKIYNTERIIHVTSNKFAF